MICWLFKLARLDPCHVCSVSLMIEIGFTGRFLREFSGGEWVYWGPEDGPDMTNVA